MESSCKGYGPARAKGLDSLLVGTRGNFEKTRNFNGFFPTSPQYHSNITAFSGLKRLKYTFNLSLDCFNTEKGLEYHEKSEKRKI